MVDAFLLEGIAESLYREAGEDPSEPVSPVRIARALINADVVKAVPRHALRQSWAALTPIDGRWHIVVRRDVPDAELGHTIAHELAHWALRRANIPDNEPSCDYLGAALVAPARAFRRAIKHLGADLPALADTFRTTESCVALRWGESTDTAVALVRPGLIRVRGQLEFVWPDEQTIVRWAKGRPPRGLAKTRLTDDRRRVLLFGDALGNPADSDVG